MDGVFKTSASSSASSAGAAASTPAAVALHWFGHLAAGAGMPAEVAVPEQPAETIAALAALVLGAGKTLLILVPDDEPLPALSTALDLSLRPLCLVLPSADFAARIALRATISLLKSRIARDNEDEQNAAWQAQHALIKQQPELWQQALQWSAGNDRSAWPLDVARLFPVQILPVAAYRNLPVHAVDCVAFYKCEAGLDALAVAGQQLHIGHRDPTPNHRALAHSDETARLRMELSQLTQDVGELELELATAQAEMTDFTRRYYEQVGRRMTELDDLRSRLATRHAAAVPDDAKARQTAEQWQQEARRSAEESRRFAEAEAGNPSVEAAPFRPSQDVKRLFRQLAQKIHPDRASDEADRAWRTQLMSEANRAYRAADAEGLREVASLWEEGCRDLTPEKRSLATPKELLVQQIERMKQRFGEIQRELHRLFGSKLYELFVAARQAWRDGRDLLREMATALDTQLTTARHQLEAMGGIS
jgi:hypothetical protein